MRVPERIRVLQVSGTGRYITREILKEKTYRELVNSILIRFGSYGLQSLDSSCEKKKKLGVVRACFASFLSHSFIHSFQTSLMRR